MVGVDSHGIPRAPRYLGTFSLLVTLFHLQDCHPLRSPLPEQFGYNVFCNHTLVTVWRNVPQPSYNNAYQLTLHEFLARPLSLTTTEGITFVLFSSRYLDVSVHAVRFCILCIQIQILGLQPSGLPHSEIPGSKLYWQLAEAYGSLTPLSSPPDTKASSRYSFQLYTYLWKS